MRYFWLGFFMVISLSAADEIKKISDIEIDTMKFLSTDDIAKKYDPTKDAEGHLKPKPIQRIEAGFSDTNGNTRTTSLNAKYTFAHQTSIRKFAPMFYTLEASAFLARDSGRRSAEEYKILLNARQPLPREWLSYLSLGWLRNDFQDYENKVDLSIGVGKMLFRDKKQHLIVKLGPALNYESYTRGGNNHYASLNEYLEYHRKLYSAGELYLKLGAKENFSDMQNDYEINTLIGMRFKIEERLDFTVEYNALYDNLPPQGFGKTDTKLIMRIGYRF